MKKNIITTFLILGGIGISVAQNSTDALRYSQEELNGTARYKAMSGAFGALGGDFSAISQNPAGSSVFNTGEIGVSIGNSKMKYEMDFLGNRNNSKNSDFALNQLGTVFVFRNYSTDSNWKKFGIGFNYQKARDFDNGSFIYSGRNHNSIVNYFNNYANKIDPKDLEFQPGEDLHSAYRNIGIDQGYRMQQAFLGFQGYLLDELPGNQYQSRAKIPTNGVEQKYALEQYGGINKYTFNFSGQYDNIYLGLNFNSYSVDYLRLTRMQESNYATSDVKKVDFTNELRTLGGGFSLQLGAIVKATKDLRVGVTYQSPTWYTLKDEEKQSLLTDVDVTTSATTTSVKRDISPNVTNYYEEYELRTPSQWSASVAYLFGKKGLLSLDYIYKGYGYTQFTKLEGKTEVNQAIENLFTDTNSVRLGGEFRVTPQFSVRGGYRFEQSPYKNKMLMGNLNGYSFGLGYSFGGLTLDFSYDFAHREQLYQMYSVGLTDRASVKSDNHNFLLTLSMKL